MTTRRPGVTQLPEPRQRPARAPSRPTSARPPKAAQMSAARQVWSSIPNNLADRLRPLTKQLVTDAVNEIQKAVPVYAKPLEGKFREVLVGAVEMAIVKCFDNMSNPNAQDTDWKAVFRYSGRVEFLEGRTMDSLQTAVRVGARAVWRRVAATGKQLGIPNDALFVIADAIFAWVDEISTEAITGYTEAQAKASGARERRRRQLLKLLLAETPGAKQAIADLAGATDWPLPEHVAAIALECGEDPHDLPQTVFGPNVLVDLESAEPCLLIANPAEALDEIAAGLSGRHAVVGPTVPASEARRSLDCARRALTLVQRGVLPSEPVTWCADHLSTLALMSDEFLVSRLTERAMEPFIGLTVKQRDRLAATLLAWLETRGGVNEVAERLAIHPQTVRYRMHQIEKILGERLADPDERLSIEIALRARRLLEPAP
ncbi:PucR-like helix-turn-helix protein [Herbihabitans rhizosphaerae]|uniref:PucR-like helix-turn-helix protein n=1 Tax=Herbihabitans rhizosphaerae TaxID=1872711 RepID=A0A4Q7KIQ0_9PSEU|nr:PucR family transcriptional regulator [Herbihabitans rhizosphaerae]RZS34095.1 PucR-like helix-turn-helix protein [Herbihabitans rhizosphaerae]